MMNDLKNKNADLDLNALLVETISSNILDLPRDVAHTAETLVGLEGWTTLDNGMRRQTGRMVFKLVENRLLPLAYAGKTVCNKLTYSIY